MNTERTYPAPIWRKREDGTVEIQYANDRAMFEMHLQRDFRPGDVKTAEFGYGWSGTYIRSEFPIALHGPNGQSILCRNKEQLDMNLAVGWTRTLWNQVLPDDTSPVMIAGQPPHGLAEALATQNETTSTSFEYDEPVEAPEPKPKNTGQFQKKPKPELQTVDR